MTKLSCAALALVTLLVAKPCLAQGRPTGFDASRQQALEQEELKQRRAQERDRRVLRGVCAGCTDRVGQRRTQPADPFGKLPDTDTIPYPKLPTIDD
jgi:hypothetical protein